MIQIPFKAFCIDDSNKPNDIPTSKWIKKDKMYTVIEVKRLLIQNGKIGFKLAEVSLEGCYPYEFFSSDRFAVVLDQELVSEIELNELLKEAIEEEDNEIKIKE